MASHLLEGDALAKFNELATAEGTETNKHFATVMNNVTIHVFPQQALSLQKHYMRRAMRKQSSIKMREFIAPVHKSWMRT